MVSIYFKKFCFELIDHEASYFYKCYPKVSARVVHRIPDSVGQVSCPEELKTFKSLAMNNHYLLKLLGDIFLR